MPSLVRRVLLLSAALLTVAADAQAAGIVFRYLPGFGALSSEVVASNVETGVFLDARELTARGPGGWGLQAPMAAEFSAPGSTLRSAETSPLSQPLGPRLTAEVWIHLSTLNGRTPLLSNRISDAGTFEVGLEDGTPYILVHAGGQDLRVDAPTPLSLGTTAWIAATLAFDTGAQALTVTLYLNGQTAASSTLGLSIPSPFVIPRPFFVATEATGTPESYTLAGTFSGQLLAATVRDYVAPEAYLTSSAPLDGSAYLGLPAFHDYAMDDGRLSMDLRIRSNQSETRHQFFVPYVNDEFVPQGTATHIEATGTSSTPLVYLSYYHLTRSGLTGQRRSIVAEMDASTGHVRRVFRLMGDLEFSHAGGIAHVNDAIYVSSSSTLERYPLPPYEGPEADRYIDLPPDPSGTISVLGRASFVSEHRDTLWVGDWRTSTQNAPYLYGYPLDADGRAIGGTPAVIYALPRSVQGVDFFEHQGKTLVFMARNRSQSRGEAEILRVPRERLARWTEPTPDSTITVPYGIEDLSFFPDGTLWTNSESSADYYQRSSSAWSVFYPFVYSLPSEAVFGSVVTASNPSATSHGGSLQVSPNPIGTRATITATSHTTGHVLLQVTDSLGRRVATLYDGPAPASSITATWEPSNTAAGTYLIVLDTASGRVTRSITVTR